MLHCTNSIIQFLSGWELEFSPAFSRRGIIKIVEKEDEIELGGEEGDDEEKVDMVQILGKRGGVKTKISDSTIQQL